MADSDQNRLSPITKARKRHETPAYAGAEKLVPPKKTTYIPPQAALRIDAAARPAVSVLKILGTIDSDNTPWRLASRSSSSLRPPSGPINSATACGG